jgi:hypothetical protein
MIAVNTVSTAATRNASPTVSIGMCPGQLYHWQIQVSGARLCQTVKQGHGEAIVSVSSTAGLTGLRDKQTRRNRAHQKRGHRLRCGALTYDWSLSSAPNDSAAQLANQTSDRPTFKPDKAGTYVVSLVVTDSSGAKSTPDATNVTVTPTQPSNTTLTAQTSKTDLYLGTKLRLAEN